jgi:hypothetical protein
MDKTLTRKQRKERREQWKKGQRECMHPIERIFPSLQILGSTGIPLVSRSVGESETYVRKRVLLLQESFALRFHQPLVYLILSYLEEQALVFYGKQTRNWSESSKRIMVDLVAYLNNSSEKTTTCFLLLRRGPLFSIFGTGPKSIFQGYTCPSSQVLRNQPILCYRGNLNFKKRSIRMLWTREDKEEMKLLRWISKLVCEGTDGRNMWFKWKVPERVDNLSSFLETCVDQMKAWIPLSR